MIWVNFLLRNCIIGKCLAISCSSFGSRTMTAADIYIHIDRHRHRDLLCMHILWPSSCGTTGFSWPSCLRVEWWQQWQSVPELPPPTVPCHAMQCRAVQLSCLHYCTVYCVMDADTRHILIMTAGRGADERSVSQSVCLSACSVRLVCCSNPLA